MTGKSESSKGNPVLRVLLAVLVLLGVSFGLLLSYTYRPPSTATELSLDRVFELAANGQVRFATLLDEDAVIVGQRCLGEGQGGSGGSTDDFPENREPCEPPLQPFQASYPSSDAATQDLILRMSVGGAEVQVDAQTPKALANALVTYVYPVLFLATVFGLIFLSRGGGDSSLSDVAGFGSFRKKDDKALDGGKRKRLRLPRRKGARDGKGKSPEAGKVTFADVGGAQEAVTELREVTDYLKDPAKFAAYGAAAPKGALLFGPPGCGKTHLARAVAGEADVPFFAVSGAEFIESLVGVGAARVRDLFAQVRQAAPAIVFIDEIDAVGRKRSGEGVSGGEREQTVNQLLVEMDGFEVSAGIVLMGATNRPDILDPALMRPGRFDRHVTLEPPDPQGREEILRLHAKKKPLADDVDFSMLVRRTSGFTGADLANVVNEAALLVIREGGGPTIGMSHLLEAVERVLHGPRRRGKLVTPQERRRLAYHESAHAVVAAAVGQAAAVQRVSILGRGRGAGSSQISPDLSERVLLEAGEFRTTLAITMAGMAAERLVFGDVSTSAEDDLDKANATAREMVGIHGMSDEIGPLRVLRPDEGFLDSEVRLVEAISGHTLGLFDGAVRARIEEGRAVAERILEANRGRLDAMAAALEEHESLEGQPLEAELAQVPRASVTVAERKGNGDVATVGSHQDPAAVSPQRDADRPGSSDWPHGPAGS